ncbi:MAG: FAD-dependent oxidoreductase [Bdellovibrionales bacterium]|nr:FAD-dependent oxidoreductase [Bdellovibrionales bacterium]
MKRVQTSAASPSRPILVLGGGIAGCTAAWKLHREGVPVLLIEASGRFGGRIQSEQQLGATFESGMQFYYTAYTQTRRLLRATGLESKLRPAAVQGWMTWKGRKTQFSKTKPWLGIVGVLGNLKLWMAMARQALSLLFVDIFRSSASDANDGISVGEAFQKRVPHAVYELAVRPMVTSYSFNESEQHSLAMMLRILKLGIVAKPQALICGNDALPRALAGEVPTLRGQVRSIEMGEEGGVRAVIVETAEGIRRLEADQVICALPPPSAAAVFSSIPRLRELFEAIPYTATIMVNLKLDRALDPVNWVYALSREDGHQAAFAIDCRARCPEAFPDGKSVLQVSFINPLAARFLDKPDDELKRIAIEDMKIYLPQLGEWVTDTTVIRRPLAVPAFAAGTFKTVHELKNRAAGIQGLYLVGDYLRVPFVEGAVRSALDVVGPLP